MSRQVDSEAVDHVEARRRQWARELPDVDTQGMAVLGRGSWVNPRGRLPVEGGGGAPRRDGGGFAALSTRPRGGAPPPVRRPQGV